MPNVIEITDLSIPELDPYLRLTEAQLRSKRNKSQGLLIAESHKVISHALNAGLEPVSFLMERRQLQGPAAEILAQCEDVPVYTGDRALLQELTGYALTRGILCAMKRPRDLTLEEACAGAQRIAVLEGIVDPTNVGAIFRSAAALGMDAVLLDPTCCDPLHRRAVRVSMGTVFQIPWARIGAVPADWPRKGLSLLEDMGFHTAALALRDDSISIEAPSLKKREKLALVLGTEGEGLMPETIALCGDTVMIPMGHGVNSLNVAAASAVAFWEIHKKA